MLPPFACCSNSDEGSTSWRRHQSRKLTMLTFWRDGLERQLAAIDASISTLKRQMERDSSSTLS
ncbi:sigma factor SigF [Cyanobium sp. HWJ4-Hawea]|uniref:sigma factor SigF n=2 Tax=unclassified Cyanobium TaxID=2627006 RepID=UPI0020CED624|nr:sigma factor SigF [Cyanobium sp. WAJ14-Wanaka]MCP9774547.1 sigma factor SigF [Cyanobium sp. WAJ14-Wanaka]MCP9809916.1 sigma factor SigF [Cyanobium sp. HWJ4-Hawea]